MRNEPVSNGGIALIEIEKVIATLDSIAFWKVYQLCIQYPNLWYIIKDINLN